LRVSELICRGVPAHGKELLIQASRETGVPRPTASEK
jgi:hypothetical protein